MVNIQDTKIWKLTNGTLDSCVICEIDDTPHVRLANSSSEVVSVEKTEQDLLFTIKRTGSLYACCPWYTGPYSYNLDPVLLTRELASYYASRPANCSRRNYMLLKLRKIKAASNLVDVDIICKAGAVVKEQINKYDKYLQACSANNFNNYMWALSAVVRNHFDTAENIEQVFDLLATPYWKEESKRLLQGVILVE